MPFVSSDHLAILIPLILLALLFFGPKRLPELGSSIGKTINEFKKGMKEVNEPSATTSATPPAVPTAQVPQQLTAPVTPAAPAVPTSATTTAEPTPTTQE